MNPKLPKAPSIREISPEELVVLAQSGRGDALEEIWRRYQKRVWDHLLCLSRNWEDAEDLAQETYIKLQRRVGTIGEPKKLKSWLMEIATNNFLDFVRKQQRERRLLNASAKQSDVHHKTPRDMAVRNELERFLEGKDGSTLSPRQVEVIGSMLSKGLSASEIGHTLGISASAVYRIRSKAKDKAMTFCDEQQEHAKEPDNEL